MSTVTRWALKHKKLVVLFWLCLTAAGAFASLSVGGKLTKGLPIPGQPAYEANLKMLRTFGIDGHQQPTIAVLHLPAALSMRTTAGKQAAARTFAAASTGSAPSYPGPTRRSSTSSTRRPGSAPTRRPPSSASRRSRV